MKSSSVIGEEAIEAAFSENDDLACASQSVKESKPASFF
jgi:hypothetical protein